MLETERLFLRKLKDYDTDDVFNMRSNSEIMRYIREPQTSKEDSAKWTKMISQHWDTEKIGFCGIIEKTSKEFIGWCGLWNLPDTEDIEVGYAIKKSHWGKGYATEAAKEFLNYGFTELDLSQIVAVAHPENDASQQVMKKLGMIRVGIGRFYGKDLVQFKILRSDFLKG